NRTVPAWRRVVVLCNPEHGHANEDSVRRHRAQPFSSETIDPRIRLGRPDLTGEDRDLKTAGEPTRRPDLRSVRSGVTDQSRRMAVGPQCVEQIEDHVARHGTHATEVEWLQTARAFRGAARGAMPS